MAQFVNYSFDPVGDGEALQTYDSDWTKLAASTADAIGSNVYTNSIGSENANTNSTYYYSTTPSGTDYDVEATGFFSLAPSGTGFAIISVLAHMDTSVSTLTSYLGRIQAMSPLTSSLSHIYKVVAGTFTLLANGTYSATAETDIDVKLRCTKNGSATDLDLFLDGSGTAALSTSDSTAGALQSAGSIGFRINRSGSGGLGYLKTLTATEASGSLILSRASRPQQHLLIR